MKLFPRGIGSFRLILFCLAVLLASRPAWCDDAPLPDEQTMSGSASAAGSQTFQQAAYTGYRFVTPVDNPAAAAPYMRQKSGVSGGFSAGTVGADLKLAAYAQFLQMDDYDAELLLDYSGLYRLKLNSTSLWHNLERLAPASAASVASRELDSVGSYGTRTIISQANNRIKLGNYPIHLNLNYWQLVREGTTQLRFSDYNFDPNPNSVSTRSVPVDSATRQGTVGLDAHAGPLNAAYSFTIRDFSNRAPDSRDTFVARGAITAGLQAHDVVNDSRVTTHTFKLFSDLSGGLTASALYSLSRRETSTDRGDARPSSAPSDTLHSAAGDVSYTPFKELSLVLKYRRLQIDRESPATVYSPFSIIPPAPSAVYTTTPGLLLVHPSMDSVMDTLILSASYRPQPHAVYRFEYRAELESRDGLPDPQSPLNPAAVRRDSRQTHTGKANFIWKPFNAVKLNATYSYAVSDNPAYPMSFSERHSGQALISYTENGRWGVTANYLGRFESGESVSMQTRLPRESLSTSVNMSAWFNPVQCVTVTANYGFLQSRIDQANLFFSSFAPVATLQTASAYRSTAHVYSVNTAVAVARMIDLSLAFQQTFSDIHYSASDNSLNPTLSSAGIGDRSRLVATETGLTTRADWHLSRHLGCSLGYSVRMYDADQSIFDGTVHETLLALTGRW